MRRFQDLQQERIVLSIRGAALQGQLCLFMQFVKLSGQIDSSSRSRPERRERPQEERPSTVSGELPEAK